MKRFAPILIGLLHAILSFLTLIFVISNTTTFLFSMGYTFIHILIPGILVPAGIILYRIIKKNSAWWIVGIGCLISLATTFAHFAFIVSASSAI